LQQKLTLRYSGKHLLFIFLGGLALMFIIAPLINMFWATEMHILFDTVRDKDVKESITITLTVSFMTTLIFAVFAIPLAYLVSKTSGWVRNLLMGIISIPIVIPHSAAGIAVLGLVSRNTVIGKMASGIGISFIDSPWGIGAAMAYVSLPFLIISAVNGFSEVPKNMENAALNLGASRWQVFSRISLPLAKRSVYSGLILMFSRGISEFGAVIMLAYFPTITPILIYDRFTSYGLDYARPVAVIFVLICLAVFLVFYLLANKKKTE
jgi:molybdate/tungstate transport system permease protein